MQQHRRQFLIGSVAAAIALPLATPVWARGLNIGNILGGASDNALDKLALPNAFYNDQDVRIGLPFFGGGGGLFGSILSAGQRLGILDNVLHTINDAAGVAAGEAKPIFRSAIKDISFQDIPGIARQNNGGTLYLRRSANDDLHAKLSPLVDTALGDLGAYRQVDTLSAKHSFIRNAGVSREAINTSVTDQGLDGIFTYIGREEAALRKNPLGSAGDILGNIF